MTSDDLRPVDPTRPASRFARLYAAIVATRPATFISRYVNSNLDPILLRLTGGRFATTLVFPTAVLVTRGARSGATRRNAVIFFHDGEAVVLATSNAGRPRHPAWFHNLCAHPEVTFGGRPMHAAVIEDESETSRLWPLADHVFPAYATYRRNAAQTGRTIPMVRLSMERPTRQP